MNDHTAKDIAAIIPARYASSRFPGKPLAKILGKSLIQRTYENTLKCPSFTHVIVATDDRRIYDHVVSFGGAVVMTSEDCPTGTDRLIEAVNKTSALANADIIVNVQGDEPAIAALTIEKTIDALKNSPEASLSTPIALIASEEELFSNSIVKCVVDQCGFALYFSRSPIPGGKIPGMQKNAAYYKHIGLYAFRRDFLFTYGSLAHTPLQQAEDLEQLKALEHGFRIKTAVVESAAIGVDEPSDIQKLEQYLCK